MKSKDVLGGLALAVALQLGMLAGSAQTNIYLFTGSETNITLPPGTYIITAYGAAGGLSSKHVYPYSGGAEFNFSSPTDLTLLVGGLGGYGQPANGQTLIVAGGGGGGSFVVEGSTPLVVAGGGGGGAANGGAANGGNATITPYGSTGGGNDGGSGGTGNNGGNGGGYLIFGGVAAFASGAGGGGGFNTDGGFGNATYDGAYPVGGSSFEDGGVGAFGNGLNFAGGGFGGGGDGYSDASDAFGGGGGGADFPPYYFGAGGGGGSFIDSSAMAILAEVSGITNTGYPYNPYQGEIIIIAIPPPLAIGTTNAAFGFAGGVFGFNVIGPAGSNVVIQASLDLQTWMPLQTNLLGSGLLYFTDPQSTTNTRRFYRAQLSQ